MGKSVSKESLKKFRSKLKRLLVATHIRTDASLKKCLIDVIKDLDREIEKKEGQLDQYEILRLVGKILNKLPWIVSLLEKLK